MSFGEEEVNYLLKVVLADFEGKKIGKFFHILTWV